MFGRRDSDPLAGLLRDDEELTPALASELSRLAKERGEPSVVVMCRGLTRRQARATRSLLAERLEQREQQIAARHAEQHADAMRAAGIRPRPPIEWGLSPSGAIVDLAERRRDDAAEQARAESLAARRASQLEDLAVDAATMRERQQAADEFHNSELPEHLRP